MTNLFEFPRQRALYLSGATSSQARYCDSIGLIHPYKWGNPKKPNCRYSYGQVIGLAFWAQSTIATSQLRPADPIRQIVEYIITAVDNDREPDGWLVAMPDGVVEVDQDNLGWYLGRLAIAQPDGIVHLHAAAPISALIATVEQRLRD